MSSPLSGFTAVPNPQMLAFMGAQSFIMMYQAGEGWQYGKRRISAMSNEEFNKLTPEMVLEKQAVVLRNSLGTIQNSMDAMTPMIRTIVEQYGDFIREMIASIPQAVSNIVHDPNHPVGGSLPPAGTPAFLAPIIPIPRNVQEITNPPHPHLVPSVISGPNRDTRSDAEIAFEKERQMVLDRREAARIKLVNERNALQARQDELERMGKNIDIAIQKLNAFKKSYPGGTVPGNFPAATYQQRLGILVSNLSNNQIAFQKKYGYWYSPKTTT